MCPHIPRCPESTAPDREAAHTIASHPEQGWSLLCNGVVIFEDTGELLPNGATIAPHRPTDHQAPAALGGLIITDREGRPATARRPRQSPRGVSRGRGSPRG
jgi:hypothetical protein